MDVGISNVLKNILRLIKGFRVILTTLVLVEMIDQDSQSWWGLKLSMILKFEVAVGLIHRKKDTKSQLLMPRI